MCQKTQETINIKKFWHLASITPVSTVVAFARYGTLTPNLRTGYA